MKKSVLIFLLSSIPFASSAETLRDFYMRELLSRFTADANNCGNSVNENMEDRYEGLSMFVEENFKKRKEFTDSEEILELDKIAVKNYKGFDWRCYQSYDENLPGMLDSIGFSYEFAQKIIDNSDAINVSRETSF